MAIWFKTNETRRNKDSLIAIRREGLVFVGIIGQVIQERLMAIILHIITGTVLRVQATM